MESASRVPQRRKLVAYVLPMALFFGLLAVGSGLKKIGGPFWLTSPEYWTFPLQTLLCGALVFFYRDEYEFGKLRQPLFVLIVGVIIFVLWISPQTFFGQPARLVGFDPNVLAATAALLAHRHPAIRASCRCCSTRRGNLLARFSFALSDRRKIRRCSVWEVYPFLLLGCEHRIRAWTFDARLDSRIHHRHGLQRRCLSNKKSDLMRARACRDKSAPRLVDHAYTTMGILVS